MRPVVKKNTCGIWVKNALYARGEEFLPLAGMEGQRDLSPALRDGDYPPKTFGGASGGQKRCGAGPVTRIVAFFGVYWLLMRGKGMKH